MYAETSTLGKLSPTFATDKSYVHSQKGSDKKVFVLEVNHKQSSDHRKVMETIIEQIVKHDLNKEAAVRLRNGILGRD